MSLFQPSRFVERWWHFGRCPRCWRRYSDWFIDTASKGLPRYCYPCDDDAGTERQP